MSRNSDIHSSSWPLRKHLLALGRVDCKHPTCSRNSAGGHVYSYCSDIPLTAESPRDRFVH